MAEKSGAKGKRRGYAKIDEDNDVFLAFINKKKRNNKKKLTEIEELEKRDSSSLKPEQLQKLKKKPEINKENDYWHEIKDLYYQALKSNQEEGGKKQPLKKDSTVQEKAEPKVETQTTTATTAHVHHHKADIIRPVVGLLHLHQLFASPVVADEFDKVYMNISGSLGFTTFPELKAVHEFSDKVFKVGASQTAGKGLDDAVAALEQYIDASNGTAAAGKSYAYVNDVVGKLVASDFFRQHKAVEHKHHKEHHEDQKREQPKKQETPKQEAPKQEAPKQEVKQTKPESPVKTQPEQKKEEPVVQSSKKEEPVVHSSKKEAPTTTTTTTQQKEKEATRPPQENTENWENFEDDEEEEEYDEGEEEHEEKKVTTEKKSANPDDGFVEVKAKYLEKRTDGGPVRGERRGRGRRGGRRGGEGGDRGGERRRGGWRGGEGQEGQEGGYRRGGRRRGGDGQEGGEGGYRRGGWRGGENQEGQEGGYRRGGRRGEGYRGGNRRGGNQEYVQKTQEGTTQPQTQTQP